MKFTTFFLQMFPAARYSATKKRRIYCNSESFPFANVHLCLNSPKFFHWIPTFANLPKFSPATILHYTVLYTIVEFSQAGFAKDGIKKYGSTAYT